MLCTVVPIRYFGLKSVVALPPFFVLSASLGYVQRGRLQTLLVEKNRSRLSGQVSPSAKIPRERRSGTPHLKKS